LGIKTCLDVISKNFEAIKDYMQAIDENRESMLEDLFSDL